mmetsp:Transcript_26474/g.62799  ORF Transcript_26474/g.62799 Transcript_26474/m.62799 type:complete len:301 (-) Transcript_26474:62-964(-)
MELAVRHERVPGARRGRPVRGRLGRRRGRRPRVGRLLDEAHGVGCRDQNVHRRGVGARAGRRRHLQHVHRRGPVRLGRREAPEGASLRHRRAGRHTLQGVRDAQPRLSGQLLRNWDEGRRRPRQDRARDMLRHTLPRVRLPPRTRPRVRHPRVSRGVQPHHGAGALGAAAEGTGRGRAVLRPHGESGEDRPTRGGGRRRRGGEVPALLGVGALDGRVSVGGGTGDVRRGAQPGPCRPGHEQGRRDEGGHTDFGTGAKGCVWRDMRSLPECLAGTYDAREIATPLCLSPAPGMPVSCFLRE